LRVVPASELHAEVLGSDHATPAEARDEPTEGGVEFDIVGEDGEVIMRSNRLTVDDPTRQTLSMEEIEELKKAGSGSGKEIIAKIMASHQAIDEKTQFSLAKYTLRKSKKYLKRFTVFPLDVGMLSEYILDREGYKILELREETIGLIGSWANVHCGDASQFVTAEDGVSQIGGGRWLVVDDTGGLIVATLAEKMGILYPDEEEADESGEELDNEVAAEPGPELMDVNEEQKENEVSGEPSEHPVVGQLNEATNGTTIPTEGEREHGTKPAIADTAETTSINSPKPRKLPRPHIPQMSASTNTLTVIHTNNQPNLAILKYFSFDAGNPAVNHPLYKHLKSLSWLQLLSPSEDPSYIKPEVLGEEELAAMKSSKRGNYYKKRRRWEKTSKVVDEARRGGYDGLVVASSMEPVSILKELVPLVRGGGRVVVYSANAEPLVELCDYYSKERRTAYVAQQFDNPQHQQNGTPGSTSTTDDAKEEEDFPLNPTLLLAPSLQTARARHWQVLPGRTHPMMTSRGGAEGYLFTGTRVLPVEGKVEARGHFRSKKRKLGVDTPAQT
jgi:tRNA (adenine-N(1)-)-methyltransferase non-catalytic subunit